jgi:hypothetical protein
MGIFEADELPLALLSFKRPGPDLIDTKSVVVAVNKLFRVLQGEHQVPETVRIPTLDEADALSMKDAKSNIMQGKLHKGEFCFVDDKELGKLQRTGRTASLAGVLYRHNGKGDSSFVNTGHTNSANHATSLLLVRENEADAHEFKATMGILLRI